MPANSPAPPSKTSPRAACAGGEPATHSVPGLRGLVTANVVTSGTVAHGAQSAFVLNAPPGTAFSRLRWSGHAQRRDCRYALQMYAVRPDGSDATIKNVRANRAARVRAGRRRRAGPGRARSISEVRRRSSSGSSVSARPRRSSAPGAGSTTCRRSRPKRRSSTPPVPRSSIVPDTPLTRGEWVSGVQILDYEASDNVGVKKRNA